MIDFCNKVNETSVHCVKILVGQQKGETSYNIQTKHPISNFSSIPIWNHMGNYKLEGWKHGVLYKKISSLKKEFFTKKINLNFVFLLKLHFETIVLSIVFVLSGLIFLKNFGIIKVRNKYFWIWLANMVFKSIFSLENWMK